MLLFRKPGRLSAELLCCALSLLAPAGASGGELFVTVTPAFDGWFRSGGWTAAAVLLENKGSTWRGSLGVVQDGYRYQTAVEVPRDGRKIVWVPVQAAVQSGPERFVDVEPKGGEPFAAKFALRMLSTHDLLVASLSEEGSPLGALIKATSPNGPGSVNVAHLVPADLPPHLRAYEPLDAVFASRWQPGSVPPEAASALKGWIARGGVLVLSAEKDLSRLRVPWLADLLPAKVAGDSRALPMAALQRHTGVPRDERDPEPWTAALEPLAGSHVLLSAGEAPLAVTRRYGQGAVCLLAFDMADPTVASYEGWPVLALELLGLHGAPPPSTESRQNLYRHLSQKLEEAVKRVDSSTVKAVRHFSLFALAYILILVPGNYLYMGLSGRRDQIWLGMVAVIASFTAVAWGVSLINRPADMARGLFVVSAGPGSPMGQLSGWAGVFSPRRGRAAFALPPESSEITEIHPDAAGFRRKRAGAPGWSLERRPEGSILRLDLQVGELRYFYAEGQRPLGDGMRLSWKDDSRRELEWDNRTGVHFAALHVLGGPTTTVSRAQASPSGSRGTLLVDESSPAPLSLLSPELPDGTFATLAPFLESRRSPQQTLVLAVPAAGSEPAARGAKALEAKTLYLWSVPWPRSSRPTPRRIYVDPQPVRGNWHLSNDRLTLNAGSLDVSLPAAKLAAAQSDVPAAIRLEGHWTSRPEVSLFDWEAGRWMAEPDAGSAAALQETPLPSAVQASLAVSGEGLVRYAVTGPDGGLTVGWVTSVAPMNALVATGVDKGVPPGVAIDSLHRTHVVYRKGGLLRHSVKEASGWVHRDIPESAGAGPPAIDVAGVVLHAAFAVPARTPAGGGREVPGRGAWYARWEGSNWVATLIDPDPGVKAPVALTVSREAQAFYVTKAGLSSARLSGPRWETSPAGMLLPEGVAWLQAASSPRASEIVAFSPSLPRGAQLDRFTSSSYSRTWMRSSAGLPERLVAAGLARGRDAQQWVCALTESGRLLLHARSGEIVPVGVPDAKPPLACAGDMMGGAYFIYRSPRGTRLHHRPAILLGAQGMSAGRGQATVYFPKAGRFVWEEAGLVRVRVKATGPATLTSITAVGAAP